MGNRETFRAWIRMPVRFVFFLSIFSEMEQERIRNRPRVKGIPTPEQDHVPVRPPTGWYWPSLISPDYYGGKIRDTRTLSGEGVGWVHCDSAGAP